MKNWTVVMLRSDAIQDGTPLDAYCVEVRAANAEDAVVKAETELKEASK